MAEIIEKPIFIENESVEKLLDEAQYDGLDFVDGKLTVRLADESAKSGIYKLTPIVRREATGQLVTLPTSLTLKLTVYTSRKLGVSLAAKGKLDTLDPDSAVLYTVNKLTDCQGEITGLTLEGPDADRFQAELDTSGAKPQIRLTLREGETYATNVTYQVRFRLTVCGRSRACGSPRAAQSIPCPQGWCSTSPRPRICAPESH